VQGIMEMKKEFSGKIPKEAMKVAEQ